MFGFLKHNKQIQEPAPVPKAGCFGKLPIYDEFIRYNVKGRSILELDEWIQQGFSHHSRALQTGLRKPELHSYTYHFVFTGSGESHSSVIGTMMGSRDKSGRQYPFILFKMLSSQDTAALSSTLPCAYRTFFDSALNVCCTDWSLQPINMLKKRVEVLNATGNSISRRYLMESEINALQAITKEEFWRDMLGESARDYAPVYMEIMKELLDTVVRKSPLRTSWGIEIPLPANERTHIHVSFWVRAADAVLGSWGWRPHYIWGDIKDGGQQSLYLFFRPISPIFLTHLLGHRVDNGVLINLEQECKGQCDVSTMARKIGNPDAHESMVVAFDDWSSWSQN
ncbi:MAG: type VI secretion system-associated protein TagF [Candidatus Thiodiazotropha sp. (ex Monitilora ramsayi)]|nr:type VI secretion system-associated protein TagF [Candidatus Thiodiazotropha sp. (ex Monitilora ramsayi)]